MTPKLLPLIAAVALSGVCFAGAAPTEAELKGIYFAPVTSSGLWRMRMENGAVREFEPDPASGGLVSVDGWRATLDGRRVTVVSGPREKQVRKYEFDEGTLKRFSSGDLTVIPEYGGPVVYENEDLCPLWPDLNELPPEERRPESTWQNENRRLMLWFASPNQAGAFLAFFLLAGAVLAIFPRRRWMRWPGLVLALAAAAGVVRTDSRGTMVAVCVVLAGLVACALSRRGLLTRRTLIAGAVALTLAVVGGLAGMRAVSRIPQGERARSDGIRMQVWSAVPRMMRDAPQGWGPELTGAGRAYSSWYVPLDSKVRQHSLINDHLTILASWGWPGGGCYLALWFGGLWLLWAFAFRGGSPLPAAWWTCLGVCSFFNVVLLMPLLRWLPVAPLAILVFDRRWLKNRLPLHSVAVGALGAAVTLGAVFALGECGSKGGTSVHRNGGVTELNGGNPRICVVDDFETLGGIHAASELRRFYAAAPQCAPAAYATDLSEACASRRYRRLVLAGKRGQELLDAIGNGRPGLILPEEVVFISPPFAPSEIPSELFGRTRVKMIYGEFHARYFPELVKTRTWIRIVKGAEAYIPGWACYAIADPIGG